MSLKSIEMQIALPRTIDAAKLHDQFLQNAKLHSDQANVKMQQEELKQRTTVVKQEQKDNAKFHQHGGKDESGYQNLENQKKKNNQKGEEQEKHPYKGKFLDFSG